MGKIYIADNFTTTGGINLVVESLLKGGYVGTAADLKTLIVSASTGASGKSIVPTDTPEGTGIKSWTATQAGTYTNFGGVVVNANSFAVISRDAAGVFSISQTTLDLSSYAKTTDVNEKNNFQFLKTQNLSKNLLLDKVKQTGTVIGIGYYDALTGVYSAYASYNSVKFSVNHLKSYMATTSIIGGANAVAVYFDINNVYLGYEFKWVSGDIVTYTDQMLNLPINTAFIGMTCVTTGATGIPTPLLYELNQNFSAGIVANDAKALSLAKNVATNFTEITTGVAESVQGYYRKESGVFTAAAGYVSKKIPVTNDKYYFGSAVKLLGAGQSLAVYWDANNNYLGYEFDGSTTYFSRQILTLPVGTAYIGMTTNSTTVYGVLETPTKTVLSVLDSPKTGKKILWLGTSIPETGYPQIVGTNLGATVYNEALGSSMARAFKYDGSMVGLHYVNALRSLSHTIAEKQFIMDYWVSGLNSAGVITSGGTSGWKDLFIGTPPANYTTFASAAAILSWSYENKIIAKYLNSASGSFVATPDYFVIDHAYNDVASYPQYDVSDASAIASTDSRDRTTYISAMNYIIDIILLYNPRARILFVGHYENTLKPRVYQCQQNLADKWKFPLFKLWEHLGWSQQTVTDNSYWTDKFTFNPTGGALTVKTITQIWLQDNLHPDSLPTKTVIANTLTSFIKNGY